MRSAYPQTVVADRGFTQFVYRTTLLCKERWNGKLCSAKRSAEILKWQRLEVSEWDRVYSCNYVFVLRQHENVKYKFKQKVLGIDYDSCVP